ncbi:MAG TPA: alpha/beta hydrolase [Ramlibacter sp.]|nr:alpha/beta hydrolase [Ramlibacter sp.]
MTPRRIALPGVDLDVLTAGSASGDPVILLHGFPESAHAWERQLPVLAKGGFHAVAPHQRGYAGSSKPAGVWAYRLSVVAQDVLHLADALGAPRFHLVGHDWGAAVAWHLASTAPQRLRKVVILNGPHAGTVGAHAMRHPTQLFKGWYIAAFQAPWMPELMLRANGYAMLRRAMGSTAQGGALPPALLERYREQWSQPGALTAMLNWYRALAFDPPTPTVPIDVPLTVLWGEQDRFLDRGLADAGLALCRQGRLVAWAENTHWLHHERPGDVAEVLLTALA